MTRITVLDAGVLIGFVQRNDSHHRASVRALTTLAAEGDELVLSTLTFAELMVGAISRGARAIEYVLDVIDSMPRLRLVPPDRRIALAAAYIRARNGRLSLSDATVIATAEVLCADRILTTDSDFEGLSNAVQLSVFTAQ